MCDDKTAQHGSGGAEAEFWKEREDADILQVQIITDYLTHLHIPQTLQRELTDTFGCLVVVCAWELSWSVCESAGTDSRTDQHAPSLGSESGSVSADC